MLALINNLPIHQRIAHLALQLQSEERCVFALALECRRFDFQVRLGIKHAHVGSAANGQVSGIQTQYACGLQRDFGERGTQCALPCPFERQREE